MDTLINQLVRLPGGFKGDIFSDKKGNLWKKIRIKKSEKHTNGHAQKIRIVQVLTNNM